MSRVTFLESNDLRALLRLWLITGDPPRPASDEAADALVEAARGQGLAPLLDEAVTRAPANGQWAESARSRLRNLHRATLARSLRQLELARRAQEILAARGLRSLPLKGAALADTLYDSPGHRPMADVDLLALDDWAASVEALEAEGFTRGDRADHAWAFTHADYPGTLELHHSVTSCPGLFPLDREGVWERSRALPGTGARRPSSGDLLIHLCLHAAVQHGLALTLVQYLDLRRLLERTPPDLTRLATAAAGARAGRAVGAALAAAEDLVEAPIPAALRALVEDGRSPSLVGRGRDPLRFVAPAVPALARTRLALAAGRRAQLVWATLAPAPPEGPEPSVARARRVLRRTGGLLSRWALPTWRSGRPAGSRSPRTEDGAVFAEAVLRDCLGAFPHVRLTVTGDCMRPALAEGETVLLARDTPRIGDVVLVRLAIGLRLHRLVWGPPLAVSSRWRTKGDAAPRWDPAVRAADVLGTVVGVASARRRVRLPVTALRSLAEGFWARLRDGRNRWTSPRFRGNMKP